ncbi:hypothetical protein HYH02_014735 [Chlamydomonas schloesseri]|uniref:Protein kinase domain-containing protein n=1 Tax=Chlamydomonas schloesseri TaxID=2026947 RepID=A0A835SU76_9CHLO|nr:hypothetical protein HYH02_014735 [Chlamydomonas schloesseri]|eukprot:KAG2426695.1 hypothetical protein HYH02_014735 [Chlamydomonas schloesseri]
MAANMTSPQSSTPLTRIEMPHLTDASDDVFGGTRSIHSAYVFSVDKQIGEGTYGQVFMGHDRKTNDKVALKKIRMDTEKEGFPITAIREIKILSQLSHPNVVNLREIVRSEIHKNNNFKGSIYMVFDYADFDLTGLMESTKYQFTEPQVKCILKQLLRGLAYCHSNGVLHRDLKASNILIDAKGVVKLADFGLARPYTAENEAGFTNRVITLWYRPPELLLGANKYGGEVDMWSVGCIFAELLTGKPLFPGKDDLDQMDKIFQIMGPPTEAAWPGITSLGLKNYGNVPLARYPPKNRLRETLRAKAGPGRVISEAAIGLLEKMLCLDPKRRIKAQDSIMDQYLWTDPMPCEPQQLPCRGSGHEFTMKKRRNDMAHREPMAAVGQPMQLPGVPRDGGGGGGQGPGYPNAAGPYSQGPDPKRARFGQAPNAPYPGPGGPGPSSSRPSQPQQYPGGPGGGRPAQGMPGGGGGGGYMAPPGSGPQSGQRPDGGRGGQYGPGPGGAAGNYRPPGGPQQGSYGGGARGPAPGQAPGQQAWQQQQKPR